MPDIKPFRGFLYNPKKVELSEVVAPPYDVISARYQSELYDRSEYNIVRLILNRDQDPYQSAAKLLDQWRKNNIVVRDEVPHVYVLSQNFVLPDGTPAERKGFVAACLLQEFGKGSVYPHEKTHSGPKEDRFRLFQATGMMFSQIFGLYNDPSGTLDRHLHSVTSAVPDIDVMFDEVRNRLWRCRDERTMNAVAEFMRPQKIFIADGHHRYETALQYRDACRFQNPQHTGTEAYNFVPMFLTNMQDPGLIILPTHRVLHNLPDFVPEQFLEDLAKVFTLHEYESSETMLSDVRRATQHSYGLMLAGRDECWMLKLKTDPTRSHAGIEKMIEELDVTILHSVVFERILGISSEQQEQKLYIDYEKDAQRAIQAAREQNVQAAFIMNPTRIDQVRSISLAGSVMPQKSTYFYPKLLSGIVNYSFRG